MKSIDIDATLSLMTGAFLERMGAKVDLIFRFGSTVSGKSHESSDIDICWVPSDEGSWESMTVEVGGILIDLFALHWSQLSAMAEFDDARGLLLGHNSILHARDDAARERFLALGERHRALQKPEKRKEMLEKAFSLLQRGAYPLYLIERARESGSLMDALSAASRLTDALAHCAMVACQKAVDTRKEAELASLPGLPEAFISLRRELALCRDPGRMAELGRSLMDQIRAFLICEQAALCREEPDFIRNAGSGGCAEEANALRHIAHSASGADTAAFIRDAATALWEVRCHVGQGVSGRWFHDFNALSELTKDIPGLNLSGLQKAVEERDVMSAAAEAGEAEKALKALYAERGAPTNCFADDKELSRWIALEWKP